MGGQGQETDRIVCYSHDYEWGRRTPSNWTWLSSAHWPCAHVWKHALACGADEVSNYALTMLTQPPGCNVRIASPVSPYRPLIATRQTIRQMIPGRWKKIILSHDRIRFGLDGSPTYLPCQTRRNKYEWYVVALFLPKIIYLFMLFIFQLTHTASSVSSWRINNIDKKANFMKIVLRKWNLIRPVKLGLQWRRYHGDIVGWRFFFPSKRTEFGQVSGCTETWRLIDDWVELNALFSTARSIDYMLWRCHLHVRSLGSHHHDIPNKKKERQKRKLIDWKWFFITCIVMYKEIQHISTNNEC